MPLVDLGMHAGTNISTSFVSCSHLPTDSCISKPKFLIIGEGLELFVISFRRFSGMVVAHDSLRISFVNSNAFSAPRKSVWTYDRSAQAEFETVSAESSI